MPTVNYPLSPTNPSTMIRMKITNSFLSLPIPTLTSSVSVGFGAAQRGSPEYFWPASASSLPDTDRLFFAFFFPFNIFSPRPTRNRSRPFGPCLPLPPLRWIPLPPQRCRRCQDCHQPRLFALSPSLERRLHLHRGLSRKWKDLCLQDWT